MSDDILHLSDATFDEAVAGSDTPVLVDFWAEWCGPCKMIAPTLAEIATEQSGKLTVGKLNVDDNPDTARRFDVMSIPTLLVFKDGKQVKLDNEVAYHTNCFACHDAAIKARPDLATKISGSDPKGCVKCHVAK